MTSGNFLVRVDPDLHRALKRTADFENLSLNELCGLRLALPGALEGLPDSLRLAVPKLAHIASQHLLGLAIFGSWARGDATQASDIDVLVILDDGAKITRELYRKWERLAPKESLVEPHFAVLPSVGERVTGLWAELALDGCILADRSFVVHRYLNHVRHLIADGKLAQRRAHGQNYWVHLEAGLNAKS